MKRLMVKLFIQLSEITQQPVPGWIRRMLPEDEVEALESFEKDLTRTLSRPRSDRPRMPEEVRERIEEAGRSAEPARMPVERPFPTFTWAFAAVSMLVLGTFLVFRPPAPWNPSPEKVPAVVQQTGNPVEASSSNDPSPSGSSLAADALAGDLLVQPLAAEQERLAADVTNAVRYLAESFLPSAYVLPVNEGLRSVERQLTRSM